MRVALGIIKALTVAVGVAIPSMFYRLVRGNAINDNSGFSFLFILLGALALLGVAESVIKRILISKSAYSAEWEKVIKPRVVEPVALSAVFVGAELWMWLGTKVAPPSMAINICLTIISTLLMLIAWVIFVRNVFIYKTQTEKYRREREKTQFAIMVEEPTEDKNGEIMISALFVPIYSVAYLISQWFAEGFSVGFIVDIVVALIAIAVGVLSQYAIKEFGNRPNSRREMLFGDRVWKSVLSMLGYVLPRLIIAVSIMGTVSNLAMLIYHEFFIYELQLIFGSSAWMLWFSVIYLVLIYFEWQETTFYRYRKTAGRSSL